MLPETNEENRTSSSTTSDEVVLLRSTFAPLSVWRKPRRGDEDEIEVVVDDSHLTTDDFDADLEDELDDARKTGPDNRLTRREIGRRTPIRDMRLRANSLGRARIIQAVSPDSHIIHIRYVQVSI